MAKFIKSIFISFILLFGCYHTAKAQTSIFFHRIDSKYDDTCTDNFGKGHRSPPRIIIGDIDWETSSIIFYDSTSEDVLSYELWADELCIAQSPDVSDIVSILQNIDSEHITLKINTPEYVLIGEYNPNVK